MCAIFKNDIFNHLKGLKMQDLITNYLIFFVIKGLFLLINDRQVPTESNIMPNTSYILTY